MLKFEIQWISPPIYDSVPTLYQRESKEDFDARGDPEDR